MTSALCADGGCSEIACDIIDVDQDQVSNFDLTFLSRVLVQRLG